MHLGSEQCDHGDHQPGSTRADDHTRRSNDLLRWRQRYFDHECTFGTYLATRRTDHCVDHGDCKRQLHGDAQQYFRMHLDVVADRGDGDSVADDPDDYTERTDGTLTRRQRHPYKQQPDRQYLEHGCHHAIDHGRHRRQLLGALV